MFQRQKTWALLVWMGEEHVTNITDRVNEGAGPGVGREEAVDGSNPGFPASTSAISVQTPGHVGSIPAERVNGDARLIRDRGTSRQPAGHFCSNPAERECEALDNEIARLESAVKALRQQSVFFFKCSSLVDSTL